MRATHVKYLCFPSIVPMGVETEVTVFPRDTSRVFREEWTYALGVEGLRDDELDYAFKAPLDHDFRIESGCLKFRHTFEREQEYVIRLSCKGDPEEKLSVYALEEDLYRLRPLKGDLHAHSYYSDGADGIATTPADYREEGFDFFALTDHNRMYPSALAAELFADVKLGMHMMSGEEVHTPGSTLHIVHAGGTESVCNKYIHDPEGYEKAVDQLVPAFSHIPEQYRRRVAMAKWASDNIHAAGGIAILAHPFWKPSHYNVSKDFCQLVYGQELFDAFELMGGIGPTENNLQLAMWQEQALAGNRLNVVGSSDSHNRNGAERFFPNRFTLVFAEDNTTPAILDAIKKGLSVAGERPLGDPTEVRFYGNLRLVLLAHFLYKRYFNETRHLCIGEGILMRRYARGEDVGELLSAMADTVPSFYRQFYGIDPAPVITPERMAFLDKCLEAQRTVGPITKGARTFLLPKQERRE